MHLSDAIVQSTCAITARRGEERTLGTAFWFRRRVGEAPFLVTCQHVVEGAESVDLGLRGGRDRVSAGRIQPLAGVDLAILRVEQAPLAWIDAAWIADVDALAAIEPILVVGHPLGIADTETGRPIARSGITATDPKLPFCGRPEFLVDAPCYPGSSGSPVLRYTPTEATPLALLGVLIGGPALREGARTGAMADWPKSDTFHLGTAVDARHLLSL